MKIIGRLVFALLMAGLLNLSCNSRQSPGKSETSNNAVSQQTTSIEYDAMEHDFGKVKEGEKVTYRFAFTNTGEANLLVQEVRPGCGCTATNHTKEPVAPGQKGFVEVVFDTAGRPGMQEKNVAVVCNTEPPSRILTFTCEVEPKKQQ